MNIDGKMSSKNRLILGNVNFNHQESFTRIIAYQSQETRINYIVLLNGKPSRAKVL